MSANYLLLKENKQDALTQSSSINQTILKEDANASSIRSTFETMELSFSIFLILTLIFLSINVLFKLLDYLREKFHAYRSKTDTAHDEAKESSSTSSHNTQSSFESSKDSQ